MSVARLIPGRSALLVIDMQDRLVPVMQEKTTLVRRTARLVEGAQVLQLPLAVTEQNPRGLGKTVDKVAKQINGAIYRDDKMRFSAYSEKLEAFLQKFDVQSVIVAGVETHICVQQTCLELIERGYTTAVCVDATSSRREIDKKVGLQRMIQAGVVPTTVEAALFELLGDASSPKFRELRSVIESKDS